MTRKKNVLLVLKQQRPITFISIMQHAHERNWNIEYYPGAIPNHWHGDGVIVDLFTYHNEIRKIRRDIPVATLSATVRRENMCCIWNKYKNQVKMIFDYFRSRGHKNYAYIYYRPRPKNFVETFTSLTKAAGFDFYSLCWNYRNKKVNQATDFTRAVNVIQEFLLHIPKPCAIYVSSIRSIHLAYRACLQANLKIPQDISILSNTDDPGYGVNMSPTLSVVQTDFRETATLLVESLDGLMNGKPVPPVRYRIFKKMRIITRQSTDVYAVDHPSTNRAIEYIRNHYGDSQLSLRDITIAAKCTAMTLQRNFTKYLGTLPSQFLQDIRLEAAAKLLEETKLTLHEIADRVGYGSNMSLSLAFKKKYSMAPGAYRKNNTPKHIYSFFD